MPRNQDQDLKNELAQRLGMKVEEIVNVEKRPGCWAVTTHDGQTVEVPDDGSEVKPAEDSTRIQVPLSELPDQDAQHKRSATEDETQGFEQHSAANPVPGAVPDAEDAQDGEPDQSEPADGQESSEEKPPTGSAKEILAWVDGDRDRAAAALEAERNRAQPRSALVVQLERLAG